MPPLLRDFQMVGRDLYSAGLVSSHSGNMSARVDGGAMVITSNGARLGHIEAGDLVRVVAGRGAAVEPALDTPLHLAIYQACAEAKAVVHAHPHHAIALSMVRPELVPPDLEGRRWLGEVPVVPAVAVADALREYVIVLVNGHGSYARGRDLWEALRWTTVLGDSARMLWLLRSRP